MKTSSLPNIGKVVEDKLNQVGIETADQLIQTGSKEAFLKIRLHVDEGACAHMLYALEAAVQGINIPELTAETKKDLQKFKNSL